MSPAKPISLLKAAKRRKKLLKTYCSFPWVEVAVIYDRNKKTWLYDSSIYPPGGKSKTPMRKCPACKRICPPPVVPRYRRRNHPQVFPCYDCETEFSQDAFEKRAEKFVHKLPQLPQKLQACCLAAVELLVVRPKPKTLRVWVSLELSRRYWRSAISYVDFIDRPNAGLLGGLSLAQEPSQLLQQIDPRLAELREGGAICADMAGHGLDESGPQKNSLSGHYVSKQIAQHNLGVNPDARRQVRCPYCHVWGSRYRHRYPGTLRKNPRITYECKAKVCRDPKRGLYLLLAGEDPSEAYRRPISLLRGFVPKPTRTQLPLLGPKLFVKCKTSWARGALTLRGTRQGKDRHPGCKIQLLPEDKESLQKEINETMERPERFNFDCEPYNLQHIDPYQTQPSVRRISRLYGAWASEDSDYWGSFLGYPALQETRQAERLRTQQAPFFEQARSKRQTDPTIARQLYQKIIDKWPLSGGARLAEVEMAQMFGDTGNKLWDSFLRSQKSRPEPSGPSGSVHSDSDFSEDSNVWM